MVYFCSALDSSDRSAGLPAGCDAGVLARFHFGIIAKFGFTIVAPLSRPAYIASGGWEAASTAGREAGATICTTDLPLVGFQGRRPWLAFGMSN